MLSRNLPQTAAPNESPTLANTFIITRLKWLLSIKLLVSSANDGMVMNDPQNPVATSSVYFISKFKASAKTENNPSTKLPITLTTKTLTGRPQSFAEIQKSRNVEKRQPLHRLPRG